MSDKTQTPRGIGDRPVTGEELVIYEAGTDLRGNGPMWAKVRQLEGELSEARAELEQVKLERDWAVAPGRRTEREYAEHHKGQDGWHWLPHVQTPTIARWNPIEGSLLQRTPVGQFVSYDDHQRELSEARAELEEARKNGARLDWLLKMWPLEITMLVHSHHTHGPTSSEPRAAIDAAMKREG